MKNETWELVHTTKHEKIISNMWVFIVKLEPNKSLKSYKSTMVVKGFHYTEWIHYIEIFRLCS